MGLKDWIAPFITLLIGASTIFISYKNYQAQAAAKPSELARLELWSKLLTEAGMDLSALPDPDTLNSDQRVVLENYRIFLKRASLESKLRKVGIDSNRIFSLLMKRAHSSVKPTPIPIGDAVRYYRVILRALVYIWLPLAVVFIGVPIVVATVAYLYRFFTAQSVDWSSYSLPPIAVVLLILGVAAAGALVFLQNRMISAIIANNVYFYFWDIYGSKKNARDTVHAYTERLVARTYADQLFLGHQEFAHQFRENMYMAGIQEIDEYSRVLSNSAMLPRNYRVVETFETEDRIDRFVNWVRSKIGFEQLEPRIIYNLERKDQEKKEEPARVTPEAAASEGSQKNDSAKKNIAEQAKKNTAEPAEKNAKPHPDRPGENGEQPGQNPVDKGSGKTEGKTESAESESVQPAGNTTGIEKNAEQQSK